jgi:hypothetical protein
VILTGGDAAGYYQRHEVNFTTLKRMAVSPLHYWHALQHAPEDKPAFALGRAAHCAILEPQQFESRFMALPDEIKVRRGAAWDACVEANEGREILSRDDYSDAVRCGKAVRANRAAVALLDGVTPEVAVVTELRGVRVRCRVDWHGATLGELKTTANIEPEAFFAQCVRATGT